jgi:hypothetical protein
MYSFQVVSGLKYSVGCLKQRDFDEGFFHYPVLSLWNNDIPALQGVTAIIWF